MRITRHTVALAGTMLVLATACSAPTSGNDAAEEDFPSKTVKIIVPFAPGGSLDANARILADCLNNDSGEWIVENREGGGGTIGVNDLMSSSPDGHTLAYVSSSGVALTPLVNDAATYSAEDFEPVAILTEAPSGLLVRQDSPYQTAEEFFAAADAGGVTIATTGALGVYHLVASQLAEETGVTPVPFDGTAPAVTAALGGNADAVLIEVSGSTLEQLESGQFRALATGATEPVDFLPGVPTLASLGYETAVSSNYGLLAAPAGVPAEVLSAIDERVTACATQQDVAQLIGENFALNPPITGADAQAVIDEAAEQYAAVVEAQG
ncbi:Bug family tripartite tricarboxylate transporter substrate binding protein [Geodermatophilus ruber]|uniref:Tripartite-type tricarboxylate transporter, receptor component TctC n=1 Tax=Geodermatophilus ruber TaxID=504800 RepID=A0A1I4AKY5_9ACTN|nr:tripartite tricarboxylate transporter substrate binding protein [Geodermatophilus ruber]SFK56376.1 Tripartite-type tricarboxylate transporter, receptor component TctC [Geodermatophilus ruber]